MRPGRREGAGATSPSPVLEMRAASYRYPAGSGPAVGPLDLCVGPGEIVLLTGPTGCGKSTLLRLACGLLQRHGRGESGGAVRVTGLDPADMPPSLRAGTIGFVSQEPGDQVVAGTIGDEIAFGLESAGWGPDRIAERAREMQELLGLPLRPEHLVAALSGGERQKLVVAAALAGGARLLLLDEPISQLDPVSARDLLAMLRRIANGGVAILLVEHRLEAVLPHADRLVVLDRGLPVSDGPADPPDLATLRGLGLSVPGIADLADRLGVQAADIGATLRAVGRSATPVGHQAGPAPPGAPRGAGPERRAGGGQAGPAPLISGRGLRHRYASASRSTAAPAIGGIDLDLRCGEWVALLGGNGAGKSTLLGLLAGHLPGRVRAAGRRVDVPQDPDMALFCATVRQEIAWGPVEAGLPAEAVAGRVAEAASALSIEDLLDRPPQALSRGQRLRVAVAAALSCRPRALLLDEPTSGQDASQVERMMRGLASALGDGLLVFATHDVGLALRWATRVILLGGGRVLRDGPPMEVVPDLPDGVPLLVPALTRLCLDLGLSLLPACDLAERLGVPRGTGTAR